MCLKHQPHKPGCSYSLLLKLNLTSFPHSKASRHRAAAPTSPVPLHPAPAPHHRPLALGPRLAVAVSVAHGVGGKLCSLSPRVPSPEPAAPQGNLGREHTEPDAGGTSRPGQLSLRRLHPLAAPRFWRHRGRFLLPAAVRLLPPARGGRGGGAVVVRTRGLRGSLARHSCPGYT